MNAHTPGPWNVTNTSPSNALDIAVIFDAQSQVVCSVPKGSSNMAMPERRANARLIATAPDLLAALKQINSWCCFATEEDTAARLMALQQIGVHARDAIAKATS